MSIDIETAARAAFDALHALNSRPRNWDRQPDEDSGEELGRNTFRHMMQAAAGTLPSARASGGSQLQFVGSWRWIGTGRRG